MKTKQLNHNGTSTNNKLTTTKWNGKNGIADAVVYLQSNIVPDIPDKNVQKWKRTTEENKKTATK